MKFMNKFLSSVSIVAQNVMTLDTWQPSGVPKDREVPPLYIQLRGEDDFRRAKIKLLKVTV